MSIEISPVDISEHIDKVHSLLKKQNYIPQSTVLTTEERKKIYGLLFKYGRFGEKECIYGKYNRLKKQEDLDALNQKVFENMDEETRAIISKCGVNPKSVFTMYDGHCDIDSILLSSMKAYGIAQVGEYTIEITRGHPLERHSDEIESFQDSIQQQKFDTYKDGQARFRVFGEIDGKKEQIYYHSEGMRYGGHVSFMGQQIGGNFGISGFSFSPYSGMMLKDEGIANCVNDLMPFFEYFENLLSQQLVTEVSSSTITDEKPKSI